MAEGVALTRDMVNEPPNVMTPTRMAQVAQEVADRVSSLGVRAILNFAPVQLRLPEDVTVKTVNLALELETLSYALTGH